MNDNNIKLKHIKVKIIKSSEPTYWYNFRVGDIFDVYDNYSTYRYAVKEDYDKYSPEYFKMIDKEDCIIIGGKVDTVFEYKIRDNFQEALNKFDFSTVYKVMDFTDWYWGADKHAPSIKQMIDLLEELFGICLEDFKKIEDDVWCSSGGFSVKINEHGGVMIEFVLEESISNDYYEEYDFGVMDK